MDGELRVLLSEDGADSARVAEITRYLRGELVHLDVADVTSLPAGPAPPGTRTSDLVAVGGLLVNLGQSAASLSTVIRAIKDWLGRGNGPVRTVRVELGGDVLEISQASAAEQDRVIDLFVNRHTPL